MNGPVEILRNAVGFGILALFVGIVFGPGVIRKFVTNHPIAAAVPGTGLIFVVLFVELDWHPSVVG